MVKKVTTDDFKIRAIAVHGDKYDYSKTEYLKAREHVVIVCKLHGEFNQIADSHLRGSGCPACSKNVKLNTNTFIKKANEIHESKYDYSVSKYVNSLININIVCPLHGKFSQRPSHHLSGSGCPKCNAARSNLDMFIKKAKEIHGSRYDYSESIYLTNRQKINIVCKIHGSFMQMPSIHLRGIGCEKCGGTYQYGLEDFIIKANIVHNNKYDYSNTIYSNTTQQISILCKGHGEFNQIARNHLQGLGCKRCSPKGFSKSQINWLTFTEKFYNINIQHFGNSSQEHNIKNTKWKADGYHENTNTIYEFHGDYWHGNPKCYDSKFMNNVCGKPMGVLYEKTKNREHKIKELGYNLIIMWEYDWKKINRAISRLQKKIKTI